MRVDGARCQRQVIDRVGPGVVLIVFCTMGTPAATVGAGRPTALLSPGPLLAVVLRRMLGSVSL